jgi:gluconolactonase
MVTRFLCNILMLISCHFCIDANVKFSVKGPNPSAYQNLKWSKLIGGFGGCEGAQWLDGNNSPRLLFAAHHDRLVFEWSPDLGLTLLRSNSPEATSFRPDHKGGLYVVEQGTRRLMKWNDKGDTIKVLASHYQGKKLNRPNDARVDHKGRVWFTDPDYLFKKRPHERKELPGQYVFCYDPETDQIKAAIQDLIAPNGIAIDLNQKMIYVGDSKQAKIFRYALHDDGSLGQQELFYSCKHRRLDGLAFDLKGQLWYAGKEGISAINQKGELTTTIETPNFPTSMDFHKSGWVCVTLRDCVYVTNLNQ